MNPAEPQRAPFPEMEERGGLVDRFVTLLMDTAQHWAIYAAANQGYPERVAAGEAVDQVCRELAKQVQAWTERHEPTPGEPIAEPETE